MRWGRILIAAVAVPIAALLIVTLAVTAYAFKLAFAARGAPDQTRISHFAETLGRSSWDLLLIVLVVPAAIWVARSARRSTALHGAITGLAVGGLLLLSGGSLGLRTLIHAALAAAFGWLAALAVQRRKALGSGGGASHPASGSGPEHR
jgi:hypothetical protein